MLLVTTVIFLMMAAFGAAVVVALCWAAKNGQFKAMETSSKVIFDAEEPVGVVTDSFPHAAAKTKKSATKEKQS